MHKVVRRIAIAIAIVVLVGGVLVLFMASRWRGAAPEQRTALAVMRAPSAMPGEDAFPALWLLRYDVPEARQAAVAAEDVRRFVSQPVRVANQASPAHQMQVGPFRSTAAEQFDDLLAASEGGPGSCGEHCLARVREHVDAYADWTKRHARLVERVAALSRYGHYRSGFPARMDTPFPDMGMASQVQAAHALAFARGRHEEALTGVCRDAGTWRQLMPNSDSLIVSMAAARFYERSLLLFADMLAELPPAHPLPASCHAAFATPVPADSSMCSVMKGEFAFNQAAMRPVADEVRASAFFDREMTAARFAHGMVRACPDAVPGPERRRADGGQPSWGSMIRFECISNFAGCVLADIAEPAYGDYLRRGEDHATRLHAGAALVRMHGQQRDGETTLRDPHPSLRIDAASQTLVFDLEARADSKVQRLPLPSSRAGKAQAAGASAPAVGTASAVPGRSTLR